MVVLYRINQNGIKKIKFKFRFIEYVLYLCRKYAALGKVEASFFTFVDAFVDN